MGLNTRFETANAATVSQTSAALVITWTANEPTASNAQTVADGTVPTVAELGQYAANSVEIINELVAEVTALAVDVAALRANIDAGG